MQILLLLVALATLAAVFLLFKKIAELQSQLQKIWRTTLIISQSSCLIRPTWHKKSRY